MSIALEAGWQKALAAEFEKDYMHQLRSFLKEEQKQFQVFPPNKLIFNAFNTTPFDQVSVVILGQDPYHNVGQAHGLSFSVQRGISIPPSLRNIYIELKDDIDGFQSPAHGDLSSWARQGVLLLNATLTVRAHSAGSHQKKGWENFTDAAIQKLSEKREGLVFILWGNYAKQKAPLIDTRKHVILHAPHPSPFSANNGFFGSRPFSKTNELLIRFGKPPINWKLD